MSNAKPPSEPKPRLTVIDGGADDFDPFRDEDPSLNKRYFLPNGDLDPVKMGQQARRRLWRSASWSIRLAIVTNDVIQWARKHRLIWLARAFAAFKDFHFSVTPDTSMPWWYYRKKGTLTQLQEHQFRQSHEYRGLVRHGFNFDDPPSKVALNWNPVPKIPLEQDLSPEIRQLLEAHRQRRRDRVAQGLPPE